jgi:hypothetical protein
MVEFISMMMMTYAHVMMMMMMMIYALMMMMMTYAFMTMMMMMMMSSLHITLWCARVYCKISRKGVRLGQSKGSYKIISNFLAKNPHKIKYCSPKRGFEQSH